MCVVVGCAYYGYGVVNIVYACSVADDCGCVGVVIIYVVVTCDVGCCDGCGVGYVVVTVIVVFLYIVEFIVTMVMLV